MIIIVLSLKKAGAEQGVRYAAVYVQEEGQKKMKKKMYVSSICVKFSERIRFAR